jgi:hypothetical protein
VLKVVGGRWSVVGVEGGRWSVVACSRARRERRERRERLAEFGAGTFASIRRTIGGAELNAPCEG